MRTKKFTSFYLEEKQIADLKELSEQTLIPMAALVRQAIDEYLKKENK